jgi:hypothetical protein
MNGGHCRGCGRRDVFCKCPDELGTISVVGIISILLAFLVLLLFTNLKSAPIDNSRHPHPRPEWLSPDPMQEYQMEREADDNDDPPDIYDVGEEPT